MADVTITKLDNGPFLVKGSVELLDGSGNAYEVKEQFALCRCGQSHNKPFCDGTHAKVGFEDASKAP